MKDRMGRAYLTTQNAKAGMEVQVDGDFVCIEPWSVHTLQQDDNGLFILCADGRHGLDGQLEASHYVGIYPIKKV